MIRSKVFIKAGGFHVLYGMTLIMVYLSIPNLRIQVTSRCVMQNRLIGQVYVYIKIFKSRLDFYRSL